jgi:hypothetical protein
VKAKVWLGTFAMLAQVERALDVQKYFLSAKKKKISSNSKSKAVLFAFKDHLQALPLTKHVETMAKITKHRVYTLKPLMIY